MPIDNSLEIVIRAKNEASKILQDIRNDVKKAGDNIMSIGKKMTAAITLPITGLGILAVKEFGEFNSEIQRAGSFVNATTDEIEGFKKVVMDAAKGTKYSYDQVAKALGSFVGGEIDAQQATEELADVVNFALIANLNDLQEAVDISYTALVQFEKEGITMRNVMDSMAVVASSVTTRTDQFARVFSDVASSVKSAGFSFQDTNALISEFVAAGARLDTTASAINSGFINMRDVSKAGGEALEAVGLSARGLGEALSQGPVPMLEYIKQGFERANESGQGFNFLVDVLGRQAAPEFGLVMGLTGDKLQEVAGYFDDTTDASGKMLKRIKDSTPPLERLRQEYEKLAIAIGEQIVPSLLPMIDGLSGLIDKFAELDDKTKDSVIRIAAISAVIGPLLIVIASLIKASVVLAAVLSNPVVLAILLVVITLYKLIAIGWMLYHDWDQIKEGFKIYWEEIKAAFLDAVSVITSKLKPLTDVIDSTANAVAENLALIYNSVVEVFTNIAFFIIGEVVYWGELLSKVWVPLFVATDALWAWIQPTLTGIKNFFINIFSSISNVLISIWEGIFNAIASVINYIKDDVTKTLEIFKNVWESIWNWIADKVTKAWDVISGPLEKMRSALESIINLAKEVKGIAGKAGNFIGTGVTGIIQRGKGLLGFQEGGIVPGPIGAPVPALVHGGETVIPYGRGMGGINITITGNTFMSDEEAAEKIGDKLINILKLNQRL